MALNRWSLDRLTAWVGTVVVLTMFIPMGLYLTHNVTSSAERHLSERGKSLVRTLAGQIIKPMLLNDRLALHYALRKAAATDEDVRYLCIEDKNGDILASTSDQEYPTALFDLWKGHQGKVILFQTEGESLMDVSAQLPEGEGELAGRLGALHVGMSRRHATDAANRLLWFMGIVLTATLSMVLAGARIIMKTVSRPLRQLETAVSSFPQQPVHVEQLAVSGTREVESLARGFTDMLRRLKALEQDRETTQERMIHTERLAALGELAAGLAHEVHNPLDGMQECLRYLQQDPDKSPRADKYYPMLTEGLGRIAKVMREMLTFARSGRDVSIGEYRVTDVLNASKLLVAANIRNKKVRLIWRIPRDCICLCDPQGLAQAVLNLVLNAVEAAEGSAQPQVAIEATCDSQWVYVVVEDSGQGIPEELHLRIFEPFFTTKPFDKGTGLGLSVSQQLVRAVGGDLELSAEPCSLGGARFVVRFPRAATDEDCHE